MEKIYSINEQLVIEIDNYLMKYGSLMNRLKVQKFYQKKVVLKKKQRQHRRNRVNRGNKRTKEKIECKKQMKKQNQNVSKT